MPSCFYLIIRVILPKKVISGSASGAELLIFPGHNLKICNFFFYFAPDLYLWSIFNTAD